MSDRETQAVRILQRYLDIAENSGGEIWFGNGEGKQLEEATKQFLNDPQAQITVLKDRCAQLWNENAELHAELIKLRAEVKGPGVHATWRDAAVSELRLKNRYKEALAQISLMEGDSTSSDTEKFKKAVQISRDVHKV